LRFDSLILNEDDDDDDDDDADCDVADGKEYCQFESFNATCPLDQVILVDEARYGRLQLGRYPIRRPNTRIAGK